MFTGAESFNHPLNEWNLNNGKGFDGRVLKINDAQSRAVKKTVANRKKGKKPKHANGSKVLVEYEDYHHEATVQDSVTLATFQSLRG